MTGGRGSTTVSCSTTRVVRVIAGSGAAVVVAAFVGRFIAATFAVTGGLVARVCSGAVNLIGDAGAIFAFITLTLVACIFGVTFIAAETCPSRRIVDTAPAGLHGTQSVITPTAILIVNLGARVVVWTIRIGIVPVAFIAAAVFEAVDAIAQVSACCCIAETLICDAI